MLLERPATVLSVRDGWATVDLDPVTGCAGCAGTGGCGIGPLVEALRVRGPHWDVPLAANVNCQPGDRVRVCLPARRLVRAAWLAYGLPLASLWAGAVAGAALVPGAADIAGAMGAAAGLGAMLLFCARSQDHAFGGPVLMPEPGPVAGDAHG
jgi:sigma-E factor negative regulatory protein RseC